MALNTSKCNHLMPMRFKWSNELEIESQCSYDIKRFHEYRSNTVHSGLSTPIATY